MLTHGFWKRFGSWNSRTPLTSSHPSSPEVCVDAPGFEKKHDVKVLQEFAIDSVYTAKAMASCGNPPFSTLAVLQEHAPWQIEEYRSGTRVYDWTVPREWVIRDAWIASRSQWTPYDGKTVTGWPVGTFVRGRKVMWDGELTSPSQGDAVRFA